MTDDVTIKLQKEVGQLQKDMEKMTAKIDQMRTEFRTNIEAMGAEMRKLFEQVMLQMKAKDKDNGTESRGSGEGASSKARMEYVMVTGGKVTNPSSMG